MKQRSCSEAQQNCDAAANFERAHTSGTCFYCGQPVCRPCSQRVAYPPYGKVRIGDDCLIEIRGIAGELAVYAKLFRDAGYQNPRACAVAEVKDLVAAEAIRRFWR